MPVDGYLLDANNGRAIWTGAELSSVWNVGSPYRHAPSPVDYAGQPRQRVLAVRACDLSKYNDAVGKLHLCYRQLCTVIYGFEILRGFLLVVNSGTHHC